MIHLHYFYLSISHTQLPLSKLWEKLLSKAIIVRDWCVICKFILFNSILHNSWKCLQWLSTCALIICSAAAMCSVRRHPTFQRLSPSINTVDVLQPLMGQYLNLQAPLHFYLQSPSRQASINGARWGDNEVPRHRLEVGKVAKTHRAHNEKQIEEEWGSILE